MKSNLPASGTMEITIVNSLTGREERLAVPLSLTLAQLREKAFQSAAKGKATGPMDVTELRLRLGSEGAKKAGGPIKALGDDIHM